MEDIDKFDDLDFYDGFFNDIGEPLYNTKPHVKKIVDNVTEVIYFKDFKIDIDNSLYQDLVKEKEDFVKWLDEFDTSYDFVRDDFEDCYRIPKFFQFNEKLEDDLFETVLNEFNGEFIPPQFDFSIIGNEWLYEDSYIQFFLILLNFPEVIDKINEVREKLGGLILSNVNLKLYFMADFPFEENNAYSDIVIEKAIECENKITEEFYSNI